MRSAILLTTVALALAACGPGPDVVQGRVVFADVERNILVIQSSDGDAAETTVDIATADIGAPPQVGDEVRIAYRSDGETLRATRVMNVTRQEGTGTSGH